jgi:transcriptional regulator with XRE-family HTH domain
LEVEAAMLKTIIAQLKVRKNELGMSYETIASLSGLGIATVKRAFGGSEISISTLEKILLTLELDIFIKQKMSAKKILESQVEKKARDILARVIHSSSLEAQTPDKDTEARLIRATIEKILKMPKRAIWA